MFRIRPNPRRCAVLAVCIVLDACGPSAPAPVARPAAEAPSGVVAGTVMAVRQVDISGPAQGGFAAVLAALNQGPAAPAEGQETIIQKSDGNPVSIAAQTATALQPGDHVVLVPVGTDLVIRRD